MPSFTCSLAKIRGNRMHDYKNILCCEITKPSSSQLEMDKQVMLVSFSRKWVGCTLLWWRLSVLCLMWKLPLQHPGNADVCRIINVSMQNIITPYSPCSFTKTGARYEHRCVLAHENVLPLALQRLLCLCGTKPVHTVEMPEASAVAVWCDLFHVLCVCFCVEQLQ